ncbi:hypothetical protein SNEBB_009733 [Seison nebaliae]|nr:hypothetical protein SNEBB_009733 [Seison nebaliae]
MKTLQVLNSLSKSKEEFIPRNGNKVYWYSCGPTVYDQAHMGHARSYITFDIIRRIMSDYFSYNIVYCMNITDVDDKIIKNSRKSLLWRSFRKETKIEKIKETLENAIKNFEEKLTSNEDDALKKFRRNCIEIGKDLLKSENFNEMEKVKDIVAEYLDDIFGQTTQIDNEKMLEYPKIYEKEFFENMKKLNVLPPDHLTRVSEYIEENIDFIKRIIDNGYGYESNGSVYFDTMKFENSPNHTYLKLVTSARGNLDLLAEGEGQLIDLNVEKRNVQDFALWKASKPGEPKWSSPWGVGRPGWHIECSAMADSIFGKEIDVHSGGVDLKFPHHDNEIAQSEAANNSDNWCNYFLHSGHLHIEGRKMSKSLKNFVTINEALAKYSYRTIRLLFLLHPWNDSLDFSNDSMLMAIEYEKSFQELFDRSIDIFRQNNHEKLLIDGCDGLFPGYKMKKLNKIELNLMKEFEELSSETDQFLCDNFNTRNILLSFKNQLNSINRYLGSTIDNEIDFFLLYKFVVYFTQIFNIFGLNDRKIKIGFSSSKSTEQSSTSDCMYPTAFALGKFRESIRNIAKKNQEELLKECDLLRDDVLPSLGIVLEDKSLTTGSSFVIKLKDPEEILKENEAKKQAEIEKKLAQIKLKEEKDKQNSVNPKTMFLSMTDKYSEFDENGLPSKLVNGEKISESQLKKLKKQQNLQLKRFEKFQSS